MANGRWDDIRQWRPKYMHRSNWLQFTINQAPNGIILWHPIFLKPQKIEQPTDKLGIYLATVVSIGFWSECFTLQKLVCCQLPKTARILNIFGIIGFVLFDRLQNFHFHLLSPHEIDSLTPHRTDPFNLILQWYRAPFT